MVASIGKIASPAQGVGYFEKDGYYAKDDAAHREASAWKGRGAAALGLSGPVEPEAFGRVLEGEVPGGRRLGRKEIDGSITHRPGRDVTLSAPKSVSVMAMVGGDERIVEAHDRAVTATLGWIEKNAVETRMRDPATGAMVRADGQKMVASTFRHDTSRNLDPQLHTHAVIANMVQGEDAKWRTMVDDGLFAHQKAIGAIYRAELAQGLGELGYGIEKTHADGRFEIEGVPRAVIDAFSTRRAEIEATMEARGLGATADNPKLADRAALMTRAAKRDIDRGELGQSWQRQARAFGFSPSRVRSNARTAERGLTGPDLFAGPGWAAGDAAAWAVGHLAEREAVFGHAGLLAATLAREPGAVTVDAAERAIAALERDGSLHAARGLDHGRHWTTDAALARESETIALMRAGQGTEKTVMRRWVAETKLHRGRLNEGQKEAVKTILASKDRVLGIQGYAGTGKTTMLKRLRALGESQGYRTVGLAPSASAAKTLASESGIESETLQRYLARHDGIAHGRGTAAGLRTLRAANAKTMLVVDESSLASSEQMRNLLRIATTLRLPRVVLVGDEKQLGAVEAGKPFAQLKAAGMATAVMDDIVRQRDAELKAAVKASLTGDVKTAFAKLGGNIRQVEDGDLGAETARHWLNLPPGERERTGVIAPTRALRDEINVTIREGLVAEGVIDGPARQGEKLVSRDLTRAQMARASNYNIGDTVIFNRPYKRLGVEKGDERRVARIDRRWGTVHLEDAKGNATPWGPGRIAGAKGVVEVYRSEAMELRRGDRVRFTRNDPSSGLTNGETATVESVERGGRAVPSRRRQARETRAARCPAPAYRPRICRNRACVPGPDRGPDSRGDAGGKPEPGQPARVLCRDLAGAGRGPFDHRRCAQARRPARTCDRRAARGARRDGETGGLRDRLRPRSRPRTGRRSPDTHLRRDGSRPRTRRRRAARSRTRARFRSRNRPRSPPRARAGASAGTRNQQAPRRKIARALRRSRANARRIRFQRPRARPRRRGSAGCSPRVRTRKGRRR